MRERLRNAFHRHGARALAGAAIHRVHRRLHLVEDHQWYALDPNAASTVFEIRPGLRLLSHPGTSAPSIDDNPVVTSQELRERMAEGGELWAVQDGATTAFTCWIFHHRTPLLAAKDGWLPLPEGVVCLEDSLTSVQYRGQGIAPSAWTSIARSVQQTGIRWIITKVETTNLASRRAVEKAGFGEIGLMHTRRRAWSVRVTMEDAHGVGLELAKALSSP